MPSRALTDEDFRRWRTYAPRVKHIGTHSSAWGRTDPRRCKLDISFYDSLELHGVLPINRLTSYTGRDWTDSVTFHRVLSKTTVAVSFSGFYGQTPYFTSPAPLVFTLPHTLRALRFGGDQRFDLRLFNATLLTLPHLEVLRCLTSLPVPDEVLHHILSSAVLLELELGNLPQDFRRCMPSHTPLRLQHFGLRTERLEECPAVFTSLDTSRLESIKVFYHDRHNHPLAPRDQSFFASLLSCVVLKKIEFIAPAVLCSFLEVSNINLMTVTPLLKLRDLEELIITSPTGFIFDNESIKMFARSWANMRHLEFNSRYPRWQGVTDYKITLDGLAIIAKSWPNLEHLNICLTARGDFENSIKDLALDVGKLQSCSTLRSLGVGLDSPVPYKPLVVAAFLHEIFPNLSTIQGLERPELPDEWRQIQGRLRHLIGLGKRTLVDTVGVLERATLVSKQIPLTLEWKELYDLFRLKGRLP